jgi:hypothetical protein
MNELLHEYADYIGFLFRETSKQLRIQVDYSEWMLVVDRFSDLAQFDSILGMNIYVCNSLGGDDFQFCIPSKNEQDRKFLKEINDLKQSISIGDNYES